MADESRSPVHVENRDGAGPFVIVCDHAANTLPARLCRPRPAGGGPRHAHRLGPGRAAPCRDGSRRRLDAPLLWPDASRLVIDCNRALDGARPDRHDGRGHGPIPGNARPRRRRAAAPHRGDPRALPRRHRRALLDRRRAAGLPTRAGRDPHLHARLSRRSRPWEIGVIFDEDRRLADPILAALAARRGAGRRRQPALFAGRQRRLHPPPPRQGSRPAGGDDRDPQRPHRRRSRPGGVGRPAGRDPCFAVADILEAADAGA